MLCAIGGFDGLSLGKLFVGLDDRHDESKVFGQPRLDPAERYVYEIACVSSAQVAPRTIIMSKGFVPVHQIVYSPLLFMQHRKEGVFLHGCARLEPSRERILLFQGI